MKTLNLTNNETSDIKFEVSKFPDGQQQIKILSEYEFKWEIKNNYSFQIKSRLNNFKDLELIICATKSLRNLGVKEIHFYAPYFLGSRSDRKFEEGSNNYLKDVICPIINSLKFESVTVLDPHSDVLEACLNNFKKIDNYKLIEHACGLITAPIGDFTNNCILISPDAGANKKIFKVADQIGYAGDIITCSKSRNENGKLSRVEIPEFDTNKDCILIDDICDGGATFLNIAQKIKSKTINKPHHKIYLIVTHGIFSKGFKELNLYFDGIYCTNSYQDIADNEYGQKTNVKQLNIF